MIVSLRGRGDLAYRQALSYDIPIALEGNPTVVSGHKCEDVCLAIVF